MLNKNDKTEGKMTPEYVKQALLLDQLEKVRPVRTQVCSALDGSGVWEGLSQMIEMIETPQSTGDKQSTEATSKLESETPRDQP